MTDVTRLLEAATRGDKQAAAELLPLVYDELRNLAAARLVNEKPGQTLQATALVHEAYLRLIGDQHFNGRGHFFAAAAEAMWRILVEQARRKAAVKRGGGLVRGELAESEIVAAEPDTDLLALDEALAKLAETDALAADLVKLRYFAGLTSEEAAAALGLSSRTAARTWAYARAWLRKRIAAFVKKVAARGFEVKLLDAVTGRELLGLSHDTPTRTVQPQWLALDFSPDGHRLILHYGPPDQPPWVWDGTPRSEPKK